jgi:hypothetical protein
MGKLFLMMSENKRNSHSGMKRLFAIAVLFTITISSLLPQEKQKPVTLDGYVTVMESAIFDTISGPMLFDNLLHNRLNLKIYISKNITFAAEFRNRLFTGDLARVRDYYSELIGKDQGWIDMSWDIMNENSFYLNSTVDRVWLDFNFNKFQATIGRQRINWGQTFVWNPNDIFNAYSFFDVDYIERPGSDAIRLQYYPSSSSAIEAAVKADSENNITAAGLYRFNMMGYDVQLLGGYSNSSDIVAGAGWSGSIGSISFRGEGSWFHPAEAFKDTSSTIIITAGADKIFEDNSMAQLQLMYCNNPLELNNLMSINSRNLSAKDLAFSKFSVFGQFTWAATPLLNIGLSGMWFPDLKGYFTGPNIDFSLAENVDFSLIWQHFDGRINDSKQRINLVFLKVKWSF